MILEYLIIFFHFLRFHIYGSNLRYGQNLNSESHRNEYKKHKTFYSTAQTNKATAK
jgi:hypothetical protein